MSVGRVIQRNKRTPSPGGVQEPDVMVGDEHHGFEMSVDRPKRLLRIRMWGLWDEPTGEQFVKAALTFARGLEGAPWYMLADATRFMAQSTAVTELRKQLMVKILSMGCQKVAAVVSQAVHGMQFKRIANESHIGGATFPDEESAMAWLSDRRTSPR